MWERAVGILLSSLAYCILFTIGLVYIGYLVVLLSIVFLGG